MPVYYRSFGSIHRNINQPYRLLFSTAVRAGNPGNTNAKMTGKLTADVLGHIGGSFRTDSAKIPQHRFGNIQKSLFYLIAVGHDRTDNIAGMSVIRLDNNPPVQDSARLMV